MSFTNEQKIAAFDALEYQSQAMMVGWAEVSDWLLHSTSARKLRSFEFKEYQPNQGDSLLINFRRQGDSPPVYLYIVFNPYKKCWGYTSDIGVTGEYESALVALQNGIANMNSVLIDNGLAGLRS